MVIELAIFDMAGTTVAEGGAVYQALRDTLALNGLEVEDTAIQQVKGKDKREALRILIEQSTMGQSLLPGLDAIHEDFVERMIAFYQFDPTVCEMPYTTTLFRFLKEKGIKIAINTGFSRDIAQVLLDRLGWEQHGLIDASITSDEVPRGRPHPDMIHRLMQALKVTEASQVAKIGDTPADIWEGFNAGCGMRVGITTQEIEYSPLRDTPYTHLISSLSGLYSILRSPSRDDS